MANLRYYNNSGPFWDFIAGLEGKDLTDHPFFTAFMGQNNNTNNEDASGPSNSRRAERNNEEEQDSANEFDNPMDDPEEVAPEEWSPWDGNGWGIFGGGPPGFMRGGHGRGGHGRGGHGRGGHGRGGFGRHGGHGGHHGPPPPPGAGEHPPPPPPPPAAPHMDGDMPHPFEGEDGPQGPSSPFGGPCHQRGGPGPHHGGHGPHHGGPGPRHGGPGPHHGGPGPHRGGMGPRGGRCGGRGWKKNGTPFDMANLAEFFQNQFFGGPAEGNNERSAEANNGDFTPPADIFDTEASFVVHVSLPGAKKEDIAVNWDAERSELNITGVIHRPGDEEFLKTLALNERKVGAFARKVRLGSRANPAQVDAEGISAKLEDGILRVNVPKEDKEFDVIHKIDIE